MVFEIRRLIVVPALHLKFYKCVSCFCFRFAAWTDIWISIRFLLFRLIEQRLNWDFFLLLPFSGVSVHIIAKQLWPVRACAPLVMKSEICCFYIGLTKFVRNNQWNGIVTCLCPLSPRPVWNRLSDLTYRISCYKLYICIFYQLFLDGQIQNLLLSCLAQSKTTTKPHSSHLFFNI